MFYRRPGSVPDAPMGAKNKTALSKTHKRTHLAPRLLLLLLLYKFVSSETYFNQTHCARLGFEKEKTKREKMEVKLCPKFTHVFNVDTALLLCTGWVTYAMFSAQQYARTLPQALHFSPADCLPLGPPPSPACRFHLLSGGVGFACHRRRYSSTLLYCSSSPMIDKVFKVDTKDTKHDGLSFQQLNFT